MRQQALLETLGAGDVLLDDVGSERADLIRYAGASGDFNRVHWDPEYARSVGFDGVIVHGMLTMAHVARAITGRLRRPTDLLELSVRFRREVLPGERITVKGRVVAGEPDDRLVLEIWAELERDGEVLYPVTDGRAVVLANER